MGNWTVEPNEGVVVQGGHIELPSNSTNKDITYTIYYNDDECSTSTTCVVKACDSCSCNALNYKEAKCYSGEIISQELFSDNPYLKVDYFEGSAFIPFSANCGTVTVDTNGDWLSASTENDGDDDYWVEIDFGANDTCGTYAEDGVTTLTARSGTVIVKLDGYDCKTITVSQEPGVEWKNYTIEYIYKGNGFEEAKENILNTSYDNFTLTLLTDTKPQGYSAETPYKCGHWLSGNYTVRKFYTDIIQYNNGKLMVQQPDEYGGDIGVDNAIEMTFDNGEFKKTIQSSYLLKKSEKDTGARIVKVNNPGGSYEGCVHPLDKYKLCWINKVKCNACKTSLETCCTIHLNMCETKIAPSDSPNTCKLVYNGELTDSCSENKFNVEIIITFEVEQDKETAIMEFNVEEIN